MKIKARLNYKLIEALKSPARSIAINAGRRGGKTQFFIFYALKALFSTGHKANGGTVLPARVGFFSITRRLAKSIFWARLKQKLKTENVICKISEVDGTITLPNGNMLLIGGIDKVKDANRGLYLTHLIIDEAAFIQLDIVRSVLLPMLLDCDGQVIYGSSPNGFNEFQVLCERHKEAGNYYHFTTVQGGFVNENNLRQLIIDGGFTSIEVQQEFEAKFVNTGGTVYYSYNAYAHKKTINVTRKNELHWAWDFGSNPGNHTVVSVVENNVVYIIDEVCDGNVETNCNTFFTNYPPSDFPCIILYGDATGKQKVKKESNFDTIQLFLEAKGYEVILKVPDSNPHVETRQNIVNRFLSTHTTLFVNKLCVKLLNDLSSITFKPGTRIQSKGPDNKLTHSADPLGYFLVEIDKYMKANKDVIEEDRNIVDAFLQSKVNLN